MLKFGQLFPDRGEKYCCYICPELQFISLCYDFLLHDSTCAQRGTERKTQFIHQSIKNVFEIEHFPTFVGISYIVEILFPHFVLAGGSIDYFAKLVTLQEIICTQALHVTSIFNQFKKNSIFWRKLGDLNDAVDDKM